MMRHEVNLYRLWIGILFCLVKATLARNVDMFKTYLYSPSLEPIIVEILTDFLRGIDASVFR